MNGEKSALRNYDIVKVGERKRGRKERERKERRERERRERREREAERVLFH